MWERSWEREIIYKNQEDIFWSVSEKAHTDKEKNDTSKTIRVPGKNLLDLNGILLSFEDEQSLRVLIRDT